MPINNLERMIMILMMIMITIIWCGLNQWILSKCDELFSDVCCRYILWAILGRPQAEVAGKYDRVFSSSPSSYFTHQFTIVIWYTQYIQEYTVSIGYYLWNGFTTFGDLTHSSKMQNRFSSWSWWWLWSKQIIVRCWKQWWIKYFFHVK